MFRLHQAGMIRPYVSENVKENYVAVATHMVIKFMVAISPLHKVCVNVTSGTQFYNTYTHYALRYQL